MAKRRLLASVILGAFLLSGCSVGATPENRQSIATGSEPPVVSAPETTVSAQASEKSSGKSENSDGKKSPEVVKQAETETDESTNNAEKTQESEIPEQKVPDTPEEAVKAESKRLKKAESSFVEAVIKKEGDTEDIFPAAVSEVGQETCDRLNFLKKADAASIPAALASDELPETALAIKHLCPEFEGQLRKAEAGFGDGDTKVGAKSASMAKPGTYFTTSSAEKCSWSITDAKGDVIESGTPEEGATVTKINIPASAVTVTSTGCYAWLPGSG